MILPSSHSTKSWFSPRDTVTLPVWPSNIRIISVAVRSGMMQDTASSEPRDLSVMPHSPSLNVSVAASVIVSASTRRLTPVSSGLNSDADTAGRMRARFCEKTPAFTVKLCIFLTVGTRGNSSAGMPFTLPSRSFTASRKLPFSSSTRTS